MRHIHRFFLSRELAEGESAILEGDDSFHISNVLRLKPGDTIELADSGGRVFASVITTCGKNVEARAERLQPAAATASISVVQAIPSGKKMDLVVEKLSELGVMRLIPVFTERSVSGGSGAGKLGRWRRLARSAASQARRNTIMEVERPRQLGGWLSTWDGPLIALVTENDGIPLGVAVDMVVGELVVLVGPESGFSQAELELLRDRGTLLARLGPLLLRTETAALVAATIALHRRGDIG